MLSLVLLVPFLFSPIPNGNPSTDDRFWSSLDAGRVAALVRNVSPVRGVSFSELLAGPSPLGRDRGYLFVVRTDESGWAVLECQFAARRRGSRVFPVVLIRRMVLVRPGGGPAFERSDVEWFSGLELDCDLGQVVPAEYGGDLLLEGEKPERARIVARDGVELRVIRSLPASEVAAAPEQSRGFSRYSGAYDLFVDGKQVGKLNLSVDENGVVKGGFISAETGQRYAAAGRFGGPDYRLRLRITFPQSVQDAELYFWQRKPEVASGILRTLDHQYGALMVRPGVLSFDAAP